MQKAPPLALRWRSVGADLTFSPFSVGAAAPIRVMFQSDFRSFCFNQNLKDYKRKSSPFARGAVRRTEGLSAEPTAYHLYSISIRMKRIGKKISDSSFSSD